MKRGTLLLTTCAAWAAAALVTIVAGDGAYAWRASHAAGGAAMVAPRTNSVTETRVPAMTSPHAVPPPPTEPDQTNAAEPATPLTPAQLTSADVTESAGPSPQAKTPVAASNADADSPKIRRASPGTR